MFSPPHDDSLKAILANSSVNLNNQTQVCPRKKILIITEMVQSSELSIIGLTEAASTCGRTLIYKR